MMVSPGLPRVLDRMTPQRLELALMLVKEKRKMLCYHGSYMHHYADRTFFNAAMGEPRRSTLFIIERAHTRRQYVHPSANHDKVQIRSVRRNYDPWAGPVGCVRDRWSESLCTTNAMQTYVCDHVFRSLDRQDAIDRLESWGVKYVLLDEVAKPGPVDMQYHRHKLYANKFHWSPMPETNALVGDADYSWKGQETIDYRDYNAHTPSPRNAFRSVWQRTPAAHATAAASGTRGEGRAASDNVRVEQREQQGATARCDV